MESGAVGRHHLATANPGRLAVAASAFGVNEIAILLVPGPCFALSSKRGGRQESASLRQIVPALPFRGTAARLTTVSLSGLFWVSQIGSVLFGSGYVLLAFFRADLVERLHWLSEAQLIDAVAAGQVTPGPGSPRPRRSSGTCWRGPRARWWRRRGFSPRRSFSSPPAGLRPQVAGLEGRRRVPRRGQASPRWLHAVVTAQARPSRNRRCADGAPRLGAAVLLLRFKMNSTWLVVGGAVIGLCAQLFGLRR